MFNQKGVIRTFPLLIILAAVAIISYLLISSVAPFKSGIFSNLFPKNFSQAATAGVAFVDANNNVITQTSSPTVNVRLTAPWPPQVAVLLHQQQLASRHGHSAEAIAGVTTLVIYDDALRRGWTNGSYGSTINFSNTSPTYSGSKSISFRADGGWGGLEFNAPTNFSTSGYNYIQFAVYATQSNQNLAIYAEDRSFSLLGPSVPLANYGGPPTANGWKVYSVPLSDFGASNRTIGDVTIQNNTDRPQPVVYIDSVQLISSLSPTPTSTPVSTSAPTPQPSGGATLGNTRIGAILDTTDSNYMDGSRVTVGNTAFVVGSISAYVGAIDNSSSNQSYQVAVYTDSGGRPGNLVAKSATGTLTANSWNTLPTTATLSPNTSYWLMYNTNGRSGSVNSMRMDSGGQGAWSSSSTPFGIWPSSFGNSSLAPQNYSLYAASTSGGTSPSPSAPASTPTPVPTTTTSAVIAEDASFSKNVKTISPYPSNPFTTPYTFSTSTPGTKTVFVTFTSSTGQTQTFSASIQLVAPSTPTPAPIVTPTPNPTTTPVPGGSMSGLHISGDKFLNGANQQVQLHGVNFSSFEYGCINGYFNDGPQPPTQAEINGMKSWNINTVRVVLNEDCWLGINGVNPSVAGQNYINAVSNFVNLLTRNNIAAIVNLHFNAPGTHLAREQEPMADRDHSPAFWSSVANTYKGNSAVVFEPYNEPHDISWQCWRDGGCTVTGTQSGEGQFTVAGMQEMVTAIRNAGATNPITVTGLNWGSDISSWVQFKPNDPQNQLAAGWHSYGDGLSCQDLNCWNTTLVSVLNTAPIVATEIGEFDCNHTYIDQVMNWLDTHDAQGYTAWTWGNFNCSVDPALLSGSDSSFSGTPSQTYGQGFHDHLLSRP